MLRSSGSAPVWLGIGNADTVIKSNGNNPVWSNQSTLTSVPGQLHGVARVAFHDEQTRQSTTFADVTSGTVNIVTTNTCTIVMHAWATISVATAGQGCWIRGSIDGTADTTTITGGLPWTSTAGYDTVPYEWYRESVAAGTITVKLQWASTTDGSPSGYLYGGGIVVMAYNS